MAEKVVGHCIEVVRNMGKVKEAAIAWPHVVPVENDCRNNHEIANGDAISIGKEQFYEGQKYIFQQNDSQEKLLQYQNEHGTTQKMLTEELYQHLENELLSPLDSMVQSPCNSKTYLEQHHSFTDAHFADFNSHRHEELIHAHIDSSSGIQEPQSYSSPFSMTDVSESSTPSSSSGASTPEAPRSRSVSNDLNGFRNLTLSNSGSGRHLENGSADNIFGVKQHHPQSHLSHGHPRSPQTRLVEQRSQHQNGPVAIKDDPEALLQYTQSEFPYLVKPLPFYQAQSQALPTFPTSILTGIPQTQSLSSASSSHPHDTPTPSDRMQTAMTQQRPFSLSPLSSGGFIYNYPNTPPPHSSTTHTPPQEHHETDQSRFELPAFTPVHPLVAQSFTTRSLSSVAPAIALRQEKLEKYRQKRLKRNFNRAIDYGRRERACSRSRDEFGHFVPEQKSGKKTHSEREKEKMKEDLDEVNMKLAESQAEKQKLHNQLQQVLEEMMYLRKKAEEATTAKERMQQELTQQQQVNTELMKENRLLWSTVPFREIFNSFNMGRNNPLFGQAFTDKIDLSNIELNWTDSRHLEAARLEEQEVEKRWDNMTFIAGQLPNRHNHAPTS